VKQRAERSVSEYRNATRSVGQTRQAVHGHGERFREYCCSGGKTVWDLVQKASRENAHAGEAARTALSDKFDLYAPICIACKTLTARITRHAGVGNHAVTGLQ
jgi:hypothetical protein